MFNNVFKDLRYKFWEHFSLLCKWPLDPLIPSSPIVNIVFPSGSNVSTRLKKNVYAELQTVYRGGGWRLWFSLRILLEIPSTWLWPLDTQAGPNNQPSVGLFTLSTFAKRVQIITKELRAIVQMFHKLKTAENWPSGETLYIDLPLAARVLDTLW